MHERGEAARIVELAAGEWVEVRVHRTDGQIETVRIEAKSALETAAPEKPTDAEAIVPAGKAPTATTEKAPTAPSAELDVVGTRSIWIIAVAIVSAIAFFCARSCSN